MVLYQKNKYYMEKKIILVYDRVEDSKFVPNGYPREFAVLHSPEEFIDSFNLEPTVHFQLDLFSGFNKTFIDYKLSDDVDENFIYPIEQYGALEKLLGEEEQYKKYAFFNQIKESTLDKIRNKKGKIVIFSIQESCVNLKSLVFLHKKMKSLKVSPSSVVYITGHNWNVKKNYYNWCDLKKEDDYLKIMNSHAQLYVKGHDLHRRGPSVVKLEDVLKKEKRKHQFVCFNRRIRPPRYCMIAMLHHNKLLKDNLVSFSIETRDNTINKLNCLGPNGIPDSGEVTKILGNTKLCKKYLSYFDELFKMSPLTVDYEDLIKVQGPGYETREPYLESYFSIVTETPFTNKTYFSTEKIYRPMLHYHPFIVQGSPYTLKRLKKLGFKTFHPYIDESYDEIISPFRRMQKLTKEIKRICNMSKGEMHKWYYQQLDIVIHNRDLIYKYGKEYPNLVKNLLQEI